MNSASRANVLVTGGGGYIGSHAVLALLDAGHSVTVLDDLSTGFRAAVPGEAEFCAGDVGDQDLVGRLISHRRIDAIIHFAGSVVVPESVADPLKYYRNNTINSARLLECAVAKNVRHFIFSSSAAVYGIPDRNPVSEDFPARPVNPYGASKLMTEMMLADTAVAHRMNVCSLRYFNVAGADPQGRAGQSTVGATHLIKVALEVACGRRQELTIFGNDYDTADGTGVRDYIHVSDLVDAHLAALHRLLDGPAVSLILNCGYGRGYSVLEVVESVRRITGADVPVRFAPRRVGDPPALIADNRKIAASLAWRPRYADLNLIVAHAFAWEQGHIDGARRAT
jgi:UDP-glucose 4-epimerase